MKQQFAAQAEWVRPVGIAFVYFLAENYGTDPVSKFHILGPVVVMIMSGTVALESLLLGEVASEKIGYAVNRPYQVQSGLNNLATALTALLVLILDWGIFADATVVIAMLLFFIFSAANHTLSAFRRHNFKPVNLLRPLMVILLIGVLVPPLIKAL